ncbi:MAG: NAD(P)H-dependent oxidoreductase [Sphingobacteriales bacterium]|nr:NAD(P)H-dependent oxidoreductase [Sphingobacteriales bacterium]
MQPTIIAFGASSSRSSINKIFASYTAQLFEAAAVKILDLNDFHAPLYSIDVEQETGIPADVKTFSRYLDSADLIIISLAEHNGSYSAYFKNLLDWTSRYKSKLFDNKKMLLLSTSSGGRGGKSVMEAALVRFPIHGADIVAHFSLPKFQENFDARQGGVVAEDLKQEYEAAVQTTKSALQQ